MHLYFKRFRVLISGGIIFGRYLRETKTGAKVSFIPWLLVRERQHTGSTNERRLQLFRADWLTELPKPSPTNGHPCLRITYCLFSEWVWEIKIRAYLCSSEGRPDVTGKRRRSERGGRGPMGWSLGPYCAYTLRSWARFLLTSALTASTF